MAMEKDICIHMNIPQMAGRAGRRGIDKIGHVVHCNNLFNIPSKTNIKKILNGNPQKLVSKFYISYSLVLNVLKNGECKKENISEFCKKSMIKHSIDKQICNLDNEIQSKKENIENSTLRLKSSSSNKKL